MRNSERSMSTLQVILLAVATVIGPTVYGQFTIEPHPRSYPANPAPKKGSSMARTQDAAPRSLPFWDDFSTTPVDQPVTQSNYPVDSLWINNKTVWVNNGMGINPPSINVATFDGLDSTFLPYSDQVLAIGFRDSLVSQRIKLGEPDVTVAERNTVFLSFFFQWQGNGEAPDATDFLQLEFKNNLGSWESVMTIFPKSSFDRKVFYDTLIKVTGDRFFHNTFQFRFKNYGRLFGPYDTWNIDYVYLNKNRTADDTDFPDQAVASNLTSMLNGYQAMPYHHFLNTNSITSPKFVVSNNLDEFTDLTYLTEATFWNYTPGNGLVKTFVSNLGGSDTSAINDDGSGIIFPLETRTVTLEYVPDGSNAAQFDPDADSVRVKLKVKLFTGDTFDPKNGGFANDYDLNYLPIDFRTNDTLSAAYFLKDYYAYDDGIAEYSATLTQAGNRAAVQFDMLFDTADTLVGLDIYVPAYGYTSNLTTDFYVYRDNGGVPGDIAYTIPSFSLQRKGLNQFQRIRILEPFLVEEKFYIGWKAPVGATLKVGLDQSNNSGDKIFVNTNGAWTQNSDLEGSLMIRPVFGSGEIITGLPEEALEFQVFPNPTRGDFYVQGTFDGLELYSTTGQAIPLELQATGQGHKVILSSAVSGLYLLKIRLGTKTWTRKIIIQ